MSAGCTYKVSNSSPRYEPSKSVPALEKVLAEEMQNSGLKLSEITLRLSSDFGNVANVLPTANVFFPVSENSLPKLHTTEFYEASGTQYAFEQAMKAGKALAKTAVKYLTDSALRQAVKEN
mgnify:CR=1 FL=1